MFPQIQAGAKTDIAQTRQLTAKEFEPMKRHLPIMALAIAVCVGAWTDSAMADRGARTTRWARKHADKTPWQGNYYHTATGRAVPLVVPPNVHMQISWGWGVAQSGNRPIHHQFTRDYPGTAQGARARLLPTPVWPSHTDQFGVYYLRGPWGGTPDR